MSVAVLTRHRKYKKSKRKFVSDFFDLLHRKNK